MGVDKKAANGRGKTTTINWQGLISSISNKWQSIYEQQQIHQDDRAAKAATKKQ